MKSSAGRSRPGSGRTGGARRTPVARAGATRHTTAVDLLEGFTEGRFPTTLYLDGPCEPLKAALLAELRHAWAAACHESPRAQVHRASETSVEAIVAAFQGTSLFSPRDLVIVLDVQDLGRSEKKITGLAAGIARPTGGSCLVLVERASETDRKSLGPLRAACAVHLDAAPPRRQALAAWGARRLAREGLEAGPGAIEALVEACEGDPLAFFGELDKLCTFVAAPGPVTAEDVATLLRPTVGADLGDYLAAVAGGEVAAASRRLGRLLEAGAGEGTLMFALSNLVGGALGGWARNKDLSTALRRRVSTAGLGQALDAVYRAEAAWKGGRADVVAALEQATREVTAAR